MKKMTLLVFLLFADLLYSQTYHLNVWSNGSVTSIPVQDIQKLTFVNVSNTIEGGEETTVIQAFKLLQNYPNPFNPSTTIEYEIPVEGKVRIQIFSLNGQLIKSFENTHTSAGDYSVPWDGKDTAGQTVASGFYIYRVSFANSVAAKKMLFLK
ncbi:MAG: FlgD immunoglobulin-like domain containing protein [Candidatus Marinimicrobia bacterium]|nr:FlgD immunoglobulin-like domain containing protein [Candidatus Neomarinimicrobiota bacterium]